MASLRPAVRSPLRSAIRSAVRAYGSGEPVESAAYIRTLLNLEDVDDGTGAGAALYVAAHTNTVPMPTHAGYMKVDGSLYVMAATKPAIIDGLGAMIRPKQYERLRSHFSPNESLTGWLRAGSVNFANNLTPISIIASAEKAQSRSLSIWATATGTLKGFYAGINAAVNIGHPDDMKVQYRWLVRPLGGTTIPMLCFRYRNNSVAGYISALNVNADGTIAWFNPAAPGINGHLYDWGVDFLPDGWLSPWWNTDVYHGGGTFDHRSEVFLTTVTGGGPNMTSFTGNSDDGWEIGGVSEQDDWEGDGSQYRNDTFVGQAYEFPMIFPASNNLSVGEIADVLLTLAPTISNTEGVISFDYSPFTSYNVAETHDACLLTRQLAASKGLVNVEDNAGESLISAFDGTYENFVAFQRVRERSVHIRIRWNTTLNEFALSVDDGPESITAYSGAIPNVDGLFTLGRDARGFAHCAVKNFRYWSTDWVSA